MKTLKPKWRSLAGTLLILFGIPWLAGCGGGWSDTPQDYSGTWQGRTSHGGSVAFTVVANAVASLQIVDGQANIRIQNSVEIDGNSFSADNSDVVASTDNPLVSVQCTFDSSTHAAGSYSLTQTPNAWSGTFEASRQ